MDTTYAMAMKRKPAATVAADWFDRLAQIEGVQVLGHTERTAEFTATPQAFTAVQEKFSPDFLIEEVSGRGIT